jgi:hypothetical protein
MSQAKQEGFIYRMKISAIVKQIPDPPPVINATLFLQHAKTLKSHQTNKT